MVLRVTKFALFGLLLAHFCPKLPKKAKNAYFCEKQVHEHKQYMLKFCSIGLVRALSVVAMLLVGVEHARGGDLPRELTFGNITTSNHPDLNAVYYFTQDPAGYIWISTSSALCRYDGTRIRSYKATDSLGNNLTSTHFASAIIANDKILTVGISGLSVFDRQTLEMRVSRVTASYKCYRILATREAPSKFWVTTNHDILLYNSVTDSIEHRFDPNTIIGQDGSRTNNRLYGYMSPDGEFLVGSYDYCLVWNAAKQSFSSFATPRPDKGRSSHVGSIIAHRSNPKLLYLGTEQGLFLYNRTTKSSKRLIQADRIDAMVYDNQGRLWVGSSIGLLCLNKEDQIVAHYTHASNNPNSLADNLIHNIFIDNQNSLWVGTERGISVVSLSNVYHHFNLFEITGDARGNHIHKIIRDSLHRNVIMAGSNGVVIYNEQSGKSIWLSTQSEKSQHRLLADKVVGVTLDKAQDMLWLSTSQGLHSYDTRRERTAWYNIVSADPKFHSGWLYNVSQDQQGMLYMSTFENGIFAIHKSELLSGVKGQVFRATKHYTASSDRYLLKNDKSVPLPYFTDPNSIWISYQGAGVERIKRDTAVQMAVWDRQHDNLDDQNVHSMRAIRGGKLLVQTYRGFYTIDTADYELKKLSVVGLGKTLKMVSPIDSSLFWTCTELGLQKVDIERAAVVQHAELPTASKLTDIFYDNSNQRLYYSTKSAYGYIQTDLLPVTRTLSGVVITGLQLRGESVEVGQSYDERVILPRAIEYIDHLELDYNQNTFTLEFSSPNHSWFSSAIFNYRLLGLSEQWEQTNTGDKGAKFTGVRPGNYTFQVAMVNQTGELLSNVASIEITVLPPWWLSAWAYVVYSMIVAALLAFVWLRIRERQRARIEKVKREKSLLYSQMKIGFLADIFKRLSDPIGHIVSQVPHNEQVRESVNSLREISSQFIGVINTHNEQIDADQQTVSNMLLWKTEHEVQLGSLAPMPQSTEHKLLDNLAQIVEQNMQDEGLNVATLSSISGLSAKRIYSLLKSAHGVTPTDYIRHMRLQHAAKLLRQGGFSVSEVLYLVGFSSHSYFTKCFKAEFGSTPKEYSKMTSE